MGRELDLEGTTVNEIRLESFRERLWCACGGEIVATGHGYSTLKSYWYHKCKRCGLEGSIEGTKYPRTVHREVEG